MLPLPSGRGGVSVSSALLPAAGRVRGRAAEAAGSSSSAWTGWIGGRFFVADFVPDWAMRSAVNARDKLLMARPARTGFNMRDIKVKVLPSKPQKFGWNTAADASRGGELRL